MRKWDHTLKGCPFVCQRPIDTSLCSRQVKLDHLGHCTRWTHAIITDVSANVTEVEGETTTQSCILLNVRSIAKINSPIDEEEEEEIISVFSELVSFHLMIRSIPMLTGSNAWFDLRYSRRRRRESQDTDRDRQSDREREKDSNVLFAFDLTH